MTSQHSICPEIKYCPAELKIKNRRMCLGAEYFGNCPAYNELREIKEKTLEVADRKTLIGCLTESPRQMKGDRE